MVSIIVPVYNVYEYIDECVNSLVNQTYTDIEILLINDGSKDNSWDKCVKWSRKDNRIHIFTKENEGLGPTRNFGVEKSNGEYIMYVDSDDWVDTTIVEKLINSITETESDIAVCDRYNYISANTSYDIIRNELNYDTKCVNVADDLDVIKNIRCVAWSKIYKKSLLIDNNIKQPKCEWEDVIIPITLACAKRISYINEPLYFYRIDRKGSISNSLDFLDNFKFVKVLINEFKSRMLYEKFRFQIKEIIEFRVKWNVLKAYSNQSRINEEITQKIRKYSSDIKKFLLLNNIGSRDEIEKIISFQNLSVCVIGSYNLIASVRTINNMDYSSDLNKIFSFSSLSSIMSPVNLNLLSISFDAENLFRKRHIINDICKEFMHLSCASIDDCSAILIDFLDDRFDIGCIDNCYITLSDAFLNSTLKLKIKYNIIGALSEENELIWEDACLRFINLLETRYKNKKIILVKTKLAEYYGVGNNIKKYKQNVLEINEMLERRYMFFVKHCSRVKVVEPIKSSLYYTDENFRHGCFPWHLNNEMYKEIGKSIVEFL